jgi:hypothetical protein
MSLTLAQLSHWIVEKLAAFEVKQNPHTRSTLHAIIELQR